MVEHRSCFVVRVCSRARNDLGLESRERLLERTRFHLRRESTLRPGGHVAWWTRWSRFLTTPRKLFSALLGLRNQRTVACDAFVSTYTSHSIASNRIYESFELRPLESYLICSRLIQMPTLSSTHSIRFVLLQSYELRNLQVRTMQSCWIGKTSTTSDSKKERKVVVQPIYRI